MILGRYIATEAAHDKQYFRWLLKSMTDPELGNHGFGIRLADLMLCSVEVAERLPSLAPTECSNKSQVDIVFPAQTP